MESQDPNIIPQTSPSPVPDPGYFPHASAPVSALPENDLPDDDLDLPELGSTTPSEPSLSANDEIQTPVQAPAPLPEPKPEVPSFVAPAPAPAMEPARQSFTQIPVELIRPNPWQPRKVFKEEQLKELSDSIREHGVLQPLVVVPLPDGYFQLIVGERRLRASQMAGLAKVPVIIRDAMEEQKKLELALIENIQRHNLDPIEEAMAYQQLIDNYRLTQEEVAKKVGKGRTTVTNMLRLLHLPLKIQRAVAEDVITEGHARAILGLIGMEKQLALFDVIVTENLTVRQVEDKVREIMERPKQIKAPRGNSDPEVVALESELRGKLGTKVKVQKRGDSGRIMIEFYSREELNNLLDKIGNSAKFDS